MIQPVTNSQAAYREINEIEKTLRGGGAERSSFAEQHGGDDLDFAGIVIPEVDSLSQTDQPTTTSTAARMRATLLAAIKRDALHRYASRGDLFRQANQSEILAAYELGRALELTE